MYFASLNCNCNHNIFIIISNLNLYEKIVGIYRFLNIFQGQYEYCMTYFLLRIVKSKHNPHVAS